MLYPLYLETREKKGAVELMLTSVRHWHSMGGRQGYSLTGASSLSSAFGRGDQMPEAQPRARRGGRAAGQSLRSAIEGGRM